MEIEEDVLELEITKYETKSKEEVEMEPNSKILIELEKHISQQELAIAVLHDLEQKILAEPLVLLEETSSQFTEILEPLLISQ